MARYRLLTRGVHDTQAPAHDVFRDNYVEWRDYQTWLATGNVPDPLIPPPPTYATLAAQRLEMLARLDAFANDIRAGVLFSAAGHTWRLTPQFLAMLSLALAATPPLPGGFVLHDAARVAVPLNIVQLKSVGTAALDVLLAIGSIYTAFVTTINASPAPLTVDISIGWP